MKKSSLLLLIFTSAVLAAPVLQMNVAFLALSDLIPFITDREKFMSKNNEVDIQKKLTEIQSAFRGAKHESVIKEDLFAPSYALINENLAGSLEAFKLGKKDYAHWRLKEITSLCLDCHTRMPESHPSSFQNGELSINPAKFENPYNLGIAQLIVRRYADAKASFDRSIQDKLIKKEMQDLILPFKQILLIETKVLKNPDNLILFLNQYSERKDISESVRGPILEWLKRLKFWKGNKNLAGIKSDNDIELLIQKELMPLKKKSFYGSGYDVDLLFYSGLLSHYLFENPSTKKAPEISFWLGWAEKYLKRENFFGSGDLFLKQCVKRYSKNPVAKQCLAEYKESLEFEFSGSAGTSIPQDAQEEFNSLNNLIYPKKKK